MLRYARWVLSAGIVAALAIGSLSLVRQGTAADEDKELRASIDKLADAIAGKDAASAKSQGEAIAEKTDDLETVMNLMNPRDEGGFGVGPAPGKIMPDGIEKKIQAIAMGKEALGPDQVNEQAAALERLANRVAAIAEVAQHLCPVKEKKGKKDPKDWQTWTQDMRAHAGELATAARAKDAAAVKAAVGKLDQTCTSCHKVFKPS
jgi:cytochrome c556